ncbi:MAG TPA: hypothetical protein VKJ07_21170, partial [Mycobacteriales bacterium]|nr:hypothetical protein [Mycobacteriales bacterium]
MVEKFPTVAPLTGALIDTFSGVEPGAPEGTTGEVASLLMITGVETVWFPAVSVATACTWYAAGGSGPVIQVTSPLQDVPLHAIVANTEPLPQSLMLARPTSSVADALTLMLLP